MTGATILGCLGPVLSASEAAFFREADPWGFILFARNVESPDQLRRLTGDLRAAVGRDALVCVDQEGGRVQRLRAPHWREFLPPLDQAARVAAHHGPDAAARSLWLAARLIAQDLRGVGIDSNCAPCADIAGPLTHPFLRNRCLGEDAATVVRHARAVAAGLLAGGVVPVVKHMPGHGRARADTHFDLPLIEATPEDLAQTDFAVFAALADLPMGMTAHIRLPGFGTAPATLNPAIIALIRDRIGFGGLLMSDDLSMQALAGDLGDRAGSAIAAGCDLALHCNGDPAEMAAVVAAAGSLTDAATHRADGALAARHPPDAIDSAALAAELEALLGDGDHG